MATTPDIIKVKDLTRKQQETLTDHLQAQLKFEVELAGVWDPEDDRVCRDCELRLARTKFKPCEHMTYCFHCMYQRWHGDDGKMDAFRTTAFKCPTCKTPATGTLIRLYNQEPQINVTQAFLDNEKALGEFIRNNPFPFRLAFDVEP